VENVGHEARYLPAEAALHVGGDWYTVQPLSDGRVGMAVGDVVGRGLDAATVMGQLRSALCAFAERAGNVAESIEHLDAFARTVPGAMSTSVVAARVDVRSHTIEYSLAGHPPPVYVTPDGDVELLDDAIGRPLAILECAQTNRPLSTKHFPPGSLVLLYSDGLIEDRSEPLDAGLEGLLATVQRHWHLPLPMLSDAIVRDILFGRRREDDIALLALRSPTANDHLFLMKERASLASLGTLRGGLRSWLDRIDVPADIAHSVLVAVGEATTNAIEHAYPEGGGLLRVEASVDDGDLVCCVTDTGRWHDNSFRTARGNGLPIMQELVDNVRIDRRRTGTTVTLRTSLPARERTALA
jgi:anti-sigma regulatory factor (Ser/Thr protein kinase)